MSYNLTYSDAEYRALLAKMGCQLPSETTERELLGMVRRLARDQGFLVYHTYRSTHSEPGFPDLCLTKPGRLIFAELKRERGKLTQDQHTWQQALSRSLPGVETYTWRPSDMPQITTILTQGAPQ